MNKAIKNWTKNTVCENVRLFFPVHFIKSRNEKLYFPIKTVYDLYSTYTYCWSFRAQNIKANHNTYHSLWRIWKTVWLLPERVHVTSANEFKPSRAKLLTLSGVTVSSFIEVCDNFLFQLLTSLESFCSKNNFPAGIYSFKVKLAKSLFDDIAYACVNSIFIVWRLH